MYSKQEINKILFLDIETVRGTKKFSDLSEIMQKMWEHKSKSIHSENEEVSSEDKYLERAGIYAEFGKVVCISCGFLQWQDDVPSFKLKSFYGKDEKEILNNFKKMLEQMKGWKLCAHNGKEFDFPFLGRRFLINQIAVPHILRTQGKKPWETDFIDTMEFWKFGDWKSYTKLELLCAVFDIPSPKDDIDGSEVGKVFWEDEDVEKIAKYCEKDVLATAQVMLRYTLFPILLEENISFSIQ